MSVRAAPDGGSREDNNNTEGTMRPIPLLPMLAAGLILTVQQVRADSCSDLAMRFAGPDRFSMKLGELDELKTCINTILREKVSASSTEARGSTSPSSPEDVSARPAAAHPQPPVLKDAE